MNTQKITPFLWFNGNAEDAINFYMSVFKQAQIVSINRSANDGKLFSATFELEGQRFMVLNAAGKFKFSEAISFFVTCKDQEEVDFFWSKLSEGGEEQACGWLKDKYGVSWQIIPKALGELLNDKNAAKVNQVMQALLKMVKIDVAELERAYRKE